jgi:hypothetical protein
MTDGPNLQRGSRGLSSRSLLKPSSIVLCAFALSMACSNGAAVEVDDAPGSAGAAAVGGAVPDPLAEPESSLRHQFELLRAGDTERLRDCFTARLHESITEEVVRQGRREAAEYAFEDLWASAEIGQLGGRSTCKVTMQNGRTLTTLILTDGRWLADTVWFR